MRREVLVLARKLNISRREAACACMEVWEWADNETIDGHIRGASGDDIDLMLGIPGFAVALESPEVGWVKLSSAGITFPRWERNNSESAKLRALESSKKARQRAKNVSRFCPDDVPESVPKKKGPLLSSLISSDSGFLSSLPNTVDTPEFRKMFGEWLTYKEERRESYKPKGLKALISRAEKLASLHGVEAVTNAMERAMSNQWQGWDSPHLFEVANGKSRKPVPMLPED